MVGWGCTNGTVMLSSSGMSVGALFSAIAPKDQGVPSFTLCAEKRGLTDCVPVFPLPVR